MSAVSVSEPGVRPILADAVDVARRALLELEPAAVGAHLGVTAEDDTAATHRFEATLRGYRGWQWAVVVAAPPGAERATVSESALLPGPDALVAPEFLPWDQRVRPGDLAPGDLLGTAADDPRLVPGYVVTGDPEVDEVETEVGLGRPRVLSLEGRAEAAERWYSDHGPDTDMAKAAPANCGLCGFYLPLAGALRAAFGVCGNAMGADGRVVHTEYGCGAHSDVVVPSGGGSPLYEAYDDAAYDVVASENPGREVAEASGAASDVVESAPDVVASGGVASDPIESGSVVPDTAAAEVSEVSAAAPIATADPIATVDSIGTVDPIASDVTSAVVPSALSEVAIVETPATVEPERSGAVEQVSSGAVDSVRTDDAESERTVDGAPGLAAAGAAPIELPDTTPADLTATDLGSATAVTDADDAPVVFARPEFAGETGEVADAGSESSSVATDSAPLDIAATAADVRESVVDTAASVVELTASTAGVGAESAEAVVELTASTAGVGAESAEAVVEPTASTAGVGAESAEAVVELTASTAGVGAESAETVVEPTAPAVGVGVEPTALTEAVAVEITDESVAEAGTVRADVADAGAGEIRDGADSSDSVVAEGESRSTVVGSGAGAPVASDVVSSGVARAESSDSAAAEVRAEFSGAASNLAGAGSAPVAVDVPEVEAGGEVVAAGVTADEVVAVERAVADSAVDAGRVAGAVGAEVFAVADEASGDVAPGSEF